MQGFNSEVTRCATVSRPVAAPDSFTRKLNNGTKLTVNQVSHGGRPIYGCRRSLCEQLCLAKEHCSIRSTSRQVSGWQRSRSWRSFGAHSSCKFCCKIVLSSNRTSEISSGPVVERIHQRCTRAEKLLTGRRVLAGWSYIHVRRDWGGTSVQ